MNSNNGNGFGSGFGQPQPFGTTSGFGVPASQNTSSFSSAPHTSGFGAGSHIFGSGISANPSFGSTSSSMFGTVNSGVFGSTQGFGSSGTGSGNQGFQSNSNNVFGTSAFGSSNNPLIQVPNLNSSVSTFGGTPSGFGTGNISGVMPGNTAVQSEADSSRPFNVGSSVFSSVRSTFGASSISANEKSAFGGNNSGVFGTGLRSTGFGTDTSGMGAGSEITVGLPMQETKFSVYGAGSSAFGTAGSASSTGNSGLDRMTGSGFGGSSSVFGTFARPASSQNNTFANKADTTAAEHNKTGPIFSAISGFSGLTGSGSVFGSTQGRENSSGRFNPSTSSSSVFVPIGITSSREQTKGAKVESMTTSNNVFDNTQSTQVFGASQTTVIDYQKPSSSAGIQSSSFGASSTFAPFQFGNPLKFSSPEGSVFGGKNSTAGIQETTQTTSSSLLFPAAASVFGGATQFSAGQTFPAVFGSAKLFSDQQKAAQSSLTSVFGGKAGSAVFSGSRQNQEPTFSTGQIGSVFGGKQNDSKSNINQQQQEAELGSFLTKESQHSKENQSFESVKKIVGRKVDIAGSSSDREHGQKNDGYVPAEKRVPSVFGGYGKPDSTFGFPTAPGTPEKGRRRRSSSLQEDISSKKSISCKRIPINLNKVNILKRHFSRFGKVKRVYPVPAKRYAVIQFETHEAAAAAKKHGAILPGLGEPLSIFWMSSSTKKSPPALEETQTSQTGVRLKKSSMTETSMSKGESSHSQVSLPSSVAAELASMSRADSDKIIEQYRIVNRTKKIVNENRSSHRVGPSQRGKSKTLPLATAGTSAGSSNSLGKPAKTDVVSVSSLRKIVATTSTEKVNVLDIRDKLIRQSLSRQATGGIHSRAFVGTCPDMCPEKERLYREEVRRLSIYEVIPGSSTLSGSTSLVDHTRAVKEYSRSSADQESPLPHELRPLPVLTMTMNYLLAEIANQGEDGKWAEWYDFIWNRTRSIRKEITQQQLCSLEVVELIEKCARFHIYCSERLCTEDMMVFDSKINSENLTKCLQTLKELYADMENKYNSFCPNEAEFRAYMVLMNLNEGDTLREVQQLRPDVRDSPEIFFAIKMYSALNSNNYVRFFRLVKSTSFLNACILHRYFNQVRARALQIILRAYTSGNKKVDVLSAIGASACNVNKEEIAVLQQKFPLPELVRLLHFESERDVREFCSYYGLMVQDAELALDRTAYVEPESSIPLWRAFELVESKRFSSVGEVINGGQLQPVQLPTPQCSFDEQGRFTGQLVGVSDITDGMQVIVKDKDAGKLSSQEYSGTLEYLDGSVSVLDAASSQNQAVVAKQQQKSFSNEAVKMIAKDLFWEVIEDLLRETAQSCVVAYQQFLIYVDAAADEFMTAVVAELAREEIMELIDAKKEQQEQLDAAEMRTREELIAADVLMSIINSIIEGEVLQIAQKEIEVAQAKDENERQAHCTSYLTQKLVQEVTDELLLQVVDQVYQVDVVARLRLLSDLQKAIELKRTSQWLSIWRKALIIRQRQKRAMLDFPCAPSMQSTSQRLRDIFPGLPEHISPLLPDKTSLLINHRAHMTLLSPLEAEKRSLTLTAHLSLASLLNNLQRIRAWQPLNLGILIQAPLLQSAQQWPQHRMKEIAHMGLQWKLLLSLPGEMEIDSQMEDNDDLMTGDLEHHDLLSVLKQWLIAKFTHVGSSVLTSSNSQDDILTQHSIEMVASASGRPKVRLGICVRHVPEFAGTVKNEQITTERGISITKGTSAILCLLPHADVSDDTKWLAARLRLARILEAKPMIPPTPLVLLLPCSAHSRPSIQTLTDQVSRWLGIEGFQQNGLLSDVAVVELPFKGRQPANVAVASPILQTQLTEAVKFLASKLPESPNLRYQCLGDVVEDMLSQHFFTPVLQDFKHRQQKDKLHQAPNTIIDLYNSVLDHIALALTASSLQDISWPAPELQSTITTQEGIPRSDWNSKEHLADIYELITNLRLPWFHYGDSSAVDWGQVCQDVWTFVEAVVQKHCNSSVSLTTRISHLLARTCLQFENICSLTQNEDHCTPIYVNGPWTDIILACVDFRLQRLHNWKEEEEEAGGNLEVFYEEADLEDFEPPASWVQALMDTDDLDGHRVEDTVEQAAMMHFAHKTVIREHDFTSNNLHHDTSIISDNEDNNISSDIGNCTNRTTVQNFRELHSVLEKSQNLLLHLGEERQKAQAFERYLEKAVQGDSSANYNTFPVMSALHSSQSQTSAVSSRMLSIIFSTPRQETDAHLWINQANPLTPNRHSLSSKLLKRRRIQQDFLTAGLLRESKMDSDEETERPCEENVPLDDRLKQFKEDLEAQRYASALFEKRLQNFLNS